MAVSCFRVVQCFTAFLLVIALGGLVTAGVVRYWWVTTFKQEGIWRSCTIIQGFVTLSCKTREDIFQFDGSLTKDILLASLAGSALLAFVAFDFALTAICQRFPSKCFIWLQVFFSFFSACGTVFTIVWAMVKYDHNNIGWAFYCLFAACGLLIFSFIFSVIMLTMRTPGSYMTTRHDDEMKMLPRHA